MRSVKRGDIPKNEDGTNKVYSVYGQAKDDFKYSKNKGKFYTC